ncbi:MAG: phosphoglycolate phosphatase [Gammaproteobacteria bacterium]
MQMPELVLFDLDGTLIDSVPDLAYSVNCALEELDLPMQGEEKVRSWVGKGAEKLVKAALTGDMDGEPEEALFQKTFDLFSDFYMQNTNKKSSYYPGVREGMDHMLAQGCKLGCVTNKRGRFTEPVLESLGILDDFSIVISGDTLPKKKPDPDQILHAVETLGTTTERTLMVGDSVNDLRAARAANVPILCVTYGYNHGNNIADSNPDFLVDSLSEMIELFP